MNPHRDDCAGLCWRHFGHDHRCCGRPAGGRHRDRFPYGLGEPQDVPAAVPAGCPALRERVAAERYALATRIAARPSQASTAIEYKVVHSHLDRALRALLPEDRAARGKLHAALGMRLRDGDVRQRILKLAELCRAARSLYRWKEAKPKLSRQEGNPGDRALDDLVADLLAIWVHVFDRKVGTSVRSGSADGDRDGNAAPMIRFIDAALAPILAVVPSEKAIRARVRRVRRSI